MLKRIFTILCSFLFLLISSGFMLQVHYCKGKVKSVEVQLAAATPLCGCKKKTKTCCTTEQTFVKLAAAQKAQSQKVEAAKVVVLDALPVVAPFAAQTSVYCLLQNKWNGYLQSPPFITYDRCVQHRVFRI